MRSRRCGWKRISSACAPCLPRSPSRASPSAPQTAAPEQNIPPSGSRSICPKQTSPCVQPVRIGKSEKTGKEELSVRVFPNQQSPFCRRGRAVSRVKRGAQYSSEKPNSKKAAFFYILSHVSGICKKKITHPAFFLHPGLESAGSAPQNVRRFSYFAKNST